MKINKYNGKINIVGARVKEARIKLAISQTDLAHDYRQIVSILSKRL